MNESIHGERAVSDPQDRVTELIEQQTAISEVLRALEAHGGRLWANRCEPRGALFQFTIPAELSRHP